MLSTYEHITFDLLATGGSSRDVQNRQQNLFWRLLKNTSQVSEAGGRFPSGLHTVNRKI